MRAWRAMVWGTLLASASLLHSADAWAQQPAVQETVRATIEGQGKLYIAPDSPAFIFLGVNPTTVSRPTTSKGLAISLANAIDSTGSVVQGFAMEFLPAFLPSVFRTDLKRYQESAWVRALANTRVSFGTTRVEGDTASTDVAFGMNMLLVDLGDPMRDRTFTKDLGRVLSRDFPEEPLPAGTPPIPESVRREVQEMRQRWVSDHWNARRTVLAAVTGLRFVQSRFSDSRGLGASAWLVHSEGLHSWGQLLFHLQYDYRRKLDTVPRSQAVVYGGRLNIGSPGLNGFLELAGRSVEHSNDPQGRWSGGLEFQLTDGVWASTGLGSGIGPSASDERVFVIANLRWAIANAARLSPR